MIERFKDPQSSQQTPLIYEDPLNSPKQDPTLSSTKEHIPRAVQVNYSQLPNNSPRSQAKDNQRYSKFNVHKN